MAEEIAGALEYFSSLFGPPPLSRIVAAPIPGAFGQGFPGFLYLSTLAYLEDSSLPAAEKAEWQGRSFREILQAHELAHQWWGNSVTFDNYRDEWLAEALANYSALLFVEKKRGAKAIEPVLEEYKRRLIAEDKEGKTAEAAGPLVFGMRLRHSDPIAWHAVTYGKSTWVLHMLRNRLGDLAFLKMLGQLAREFAGKPLTTEDLRKVAASYLPKEAPDRDLLNFFETWVYGTGIPHLELTTTTKGVAPRQVVELHLKQSKTGEDFSIDVPIEIQLPKGQKLTRWMRTGAEEETIEVKTGVAPLKILLDPKATVLKR
jgi:aminopeptidase N